MNRNSPFETAYILHLATLGGPEALGAVDVARLRAERSQRAEFRAATEHSWRNADRTSVLELIDHLLTTLRYLCDLLDHDVPFLAPRDIVEASVGVDRPTERDALLVGKAVSRAISSQLEDRTEALNKTVLSGIGALLNGQPINRILAGSKHLTSDDIAVRLGLHKATVARLCREGKFDADKTAGNQWRTTEERLMNSPYFSKTDRPEASNGQLE